MGFFLLLLMLKLLCENDSIVTNCCFFSIHSLFCTFNASLSHQIGNTFFQIIYSGAHVVDTSDDLIGH